MTLILCFSAYFVLICENEKEAGLFCGTVMAMLRGQHVSGVAFRDGGSFIHLTVKLCLFLVLSGSARADCRRCILGGL